MRFEPTIEDEQTTVFFKDEEPASRISNELPYIPARGTPAQGQISVRSYEVRAQEVPAIHTGHTGIHKTHPVRRYSNKTGIGFAIVCLIIGVIAGGVIAFGSNNGSVAHAHVTPAPVVTNVSVTPIPTPTHVLHVESSPAGATVMRIDDGNTTALGVTPLDIQVDETKGHDLVLTKDGFTPEFVKFTATDTKLAATLTAEAKEEEVVAAPVVVHHHHDAAPVVAKAMGHVNIASKPPCTIVIDGKATGFTTPKKDLELPVGHHEVTFINASEGIHLSAFVDVSATKTATLVQDFTQ